MTCMGETNILYGLIVKRTTLGRGKPRSLKKDFIVDFYRRFGGKREFKEYLHGHSDEGARLLFKFRSGTHAVNAELGRHSDRVECASCGAECECVVHVLWECSSYSTCREIFWKHSTICRIRKA